MKKTLFIGCVESSYVLLEAMLEAGYKVAERSHGFIPNVFVDITDYLDKKIEIMKTYKSEIDASPFPRNEDAIRGLASYRGATAHYKYSEAFYLVRSRVDNF